MENNWDDEFQCDYNVKFNANQYLKDTEPLSQDKLQEMAKPTNEEISIDTISHTVDINVKNFLP